jgi:cyclic beta-1,2-glucan synthetase
VFSAERFEQFAPILAAEHHVLPGRHRGRPLLARLHDNRRALLDAWRAIAASARAGQTISPAAEWLVDNFQIVEDQLREIGEDLPAGFYRELPKLADGPFEGYPRVYALACAYVEHTDSRFDPDCLVRFVRAYQTVTPLTMGELWAIAISLRLVLIENLRRVADNIVRRRAARQRADDLADVLLDPRQGDRGAALLRAIDGEPLDPAFAVELLQRLRDRDPVDTPGLVWLHGRLDAQGTSAEDVVRAEHVRQVAMQGPVRDAITSMRLLSAVEWGDLVESVSLVDETLRRDTRMAEFDFATRDRYRHAVEALARRSGRTELEVAARVAELARQRTPGDPGWFLIARGRPALDAALGVPPSAWTPAAPSLARAATARYLRACLL